MIHKPMESGVVNLCQDLYIVSIFSFVEPPPPSPVTSPLPTSLIPRRDTPSQRYHYP